MKHMVWGWAEDKIRELEEGDETFEEWKKIVLTTLKSYPSPEKLVGGMAKKVAQCLERGGAALDC
jgi:hypothetical protein